MKEIISLANFDQALVLELDWQYVQSTCAAWNSPWVFRSIYGKPPTDILNVVAFALIF